VTEIAALVVQQYEEAARQKKIKIQTDFSAGRPSSRAGGTFPPSTRFWIIWFPTRLKFSPPDKKVFLSVPLH